MVVKENTFAFYALLLLYLYINNVQISTERCYFYDLKGPFYCKTSKRCFGRYNVLLVPTS